MSNQGSFWDDIIDYVDPVFPEIDRPGEVLLHIEIEIRGDASDEIEVYVHGELSDSSKRRLMEIAASLLSEATGR